MRDASLARKTSECQSIRALRMACLNSPTLFSGREVAHGYERASKRCRIKVQYRQYFFCGVENFVDAAASSSRDDRRLSLFVASAIAILYLHFPAHDRIFLYQLYRYEPKFGKHALGWASKLRLDSPQRGFLGVISQYCRLCHSSTTLEYHHFAVFGDPRSQKV